jgi:hypothetical protein
MITEQELKKLKKARADAWKAYNKLDYEFTKALCEHKYSKKLKKAHLDAEEEYHEACRAYNDALKAYEVALKAYNDAQYVKKVDNMVNLRLTKMQIQEILLWGVTHNDMLKEVGMAFEKDQIELYIKIFLTTRKGETLDESIDELYSRFPEWKKIMEIGEPDAKKG